jgi:hypothetical protein
MGKARISSLITSVAGLPVCSQYFSRFLASLDARFMVIRLTAHFLFMLQQVNCVIFALNLILHSLWGCKITLELARNRQIR